MLQIRARLSTIQMRHRDLCLLVPKKWQSECLARADGCLRLKDYPYTQAQLDKCEWIRTVYKEPVRDPQVNNLTTILDYYQVPGE